MNATGEPDRSVRHDTSFRQDEKDCKHSPVDLSSGRTCQKAIIFSKTIDIEGLHSDLAEEDARYPSTFVLDFV